MFLDFDFLEGVPNGVLEQLRREERDRESRARASSVNSPETAPDADVDRSRRQLDDGNECCCAQNPSNILK